MAAKKLTPSQAQALSSRVSRTTGGRGQGSRNKPVTTTQQNKNTRKTPSAVVQEAAAFTQPVEQFASWEEAAKELYGGYYAIVQSVPELQELLRKAVGPPAWSEAKFEYELKQTSWWKQNSSTARDWDLSSQLDPATAQQQVDNLASRLRNMSLTEFGVQLDETQLQKLARDSLRFGWSEQMVKNAIGLEATRSGQGVGQLASGFLGQGLKATANAYGLKLSDDMLNRWTSAIATGQETKERFQQYAVNTAKNLFPAISAQLDTGLTFQDIVDPFRNVAAQILEINPESIDFIDPKFARAISNVDQSGQQRMMSFSEWGDYLRTERSFGYEYTSDAQQRAFKVGNDLANLFGRV